MTGNDDDPIYLNFESYSPAHFRMLRADRFGESFRHMDAPLSEGNYSWDLSQPDPANGLRRYVTGYRSGSASMTLWETLNGGDSWIHRGSTSGGGLTIIDACDGRTLWSALPLAVSRDGGRVYREDPSPPFWTDLLQNFCFGAKSHVYAAGVGLLIREPETGDTLWRSGFEP